MSKKTNSIFMLVLLILCLFLKSHFSLGVDTISGNQSLSGDQTIVSVAGIFEHGFFKPGNSVKYYIGMWYKQVTQQTIVWVANREKPVFDRFSSELRISQGNLVLFNESKIPIWFTNVNSTSSHVVKAVLLDDGNLVLEDGSGSSKPLWESFDDLTDTLLPGSRIGYYKKTQKKRILTSWRSPEDPAPGLFSLEPVPSDNSFIILRNKSRKLWDSGAWDENTGTFSFNPEMKLNYYFNFSYVSNDNDSYFTFSSLLYQ